MRRRDLFITLLGQTTNRCAVWTYISYRVVFGGGKHVHRPSPKWRPLLVFVGS